MLNLKGIITVKDGVQSGTSRSTGKPWQSQWVVVSHKDFEGTEHTLAMKAISEKAVKELEAVSLGDEVNISVGIAATARQWTDPDGYVQTFRGNEMFLHHVEKTTF